MRKLKIIIKCFFSFIFSNGFLSFLFFVASCLLAVPGNIALDSLLAGSIPPNPLDLLKLIQCGICLGSSLVLFFNFLGDLKIFVQKHTFSGKEPDKNKDV